MAVGCLDSFDPPLGEFQEMPAVEGVRQWVDRSKIIQLIFCLFEVS